MILSFVLQVCANGCIGAIIGAGTNELAIRYIFWKLIPAKKSDLAAKIQDVVSSELMSGAKIAERMQSGQVRDVIVRNVAEFLKGLLNREWGTVTELLSGREDVAQHISQQLRQIVWREIERHLLTSEFVANVIAPYVRRECETVWGKSAQQIAPGACEDLAAFAPARIVDFLMSGEFRTRAADVLAQIAQDVLQSHRSPQELLPAGILEAIAGIVREYTPHMVRQIAAVLKHDTMQTALASGIKKAIRRHLEQKGGARAWLTKIAVEHAMDLDKTVVDVCARVPEELLHQLKEPEREAYIADSLFSSVQDVLARPCHDLFQGVSIDRIRQNISAVLEHVLTAELCRSLAKNAGRFIEEHLSQPLDTCLRQLKLPVSHDQLAEFVLARTNELLASRYTRDVLSEQLDMLVKCAMSRPIGRLANVVSPTAFDQLAQLLSDATQQLLAERIGGFAESTGVWDIIKESVAAYDNKEIEKLVRRVCNRELVWVTVLGGLIGFFIGAMQGAVLDLLYR
jgi:uncharacterized membrane protein YheB (UPF0754 family)